MLSDLRYCTTIKRVVGTEEFHAGVFSSRNCMGCMVIPYWMTDIVRANLIIERERAQYHLELLVKDNHGDANESDDGPEGN